MNAVTLWTGGILLLTALLVANAREVGRWLLAIRLARTDPKPSPVKVRILDPVGGGQVKYRHQISGTVYPPGNVQVLVFAPDGLWYPQPRLIYAGSMWTVRAAFGNPDSTLGGPYLVVAKTGGAEITAPVKELPRDAIYSERIPVTRVEWDK